MLSLRLVGSLAAEGNGSQPVLPLAHPSEASVILVSGERASEHDSFNGACSTKIVTPPPGDGVVASAGGGVVRQGVMATTVVGEGGKVLLAQFLPTHSCLAISDVTRGLHRGFVPLRFTGPRGSTKALAGGVACMAGSLTSGSGLVFLGKAVGSALQAVRVDPGDSLGSLSQPLGDEGPVTAIACHSSRPIVAACLSSGVIGLWDYSAVNGRGRRHQSGGVGAGAGLNASGVMGDGDGYGGAPGGGLSPPTSPARSRASVKGGKDEKVPLKPRLEGKLVRIATLSVQEMPGGDLPSDVVLEGFQSIAFHPAREWLCACNEWGVVGVWNLDGVVGAGRSRRTNTGRDRGGSDGSGEALGAGSQGLQGSVRPFAVRVIALPDGTRPSKDSATAENTISSSSARRQKHNATVTCVFIPSEPVIMVGLSAKPEQTLNSSGTSPRRVAHTDSPIQGSSRLLLLSLLDGSLPVLSSIVAPHAIAELCVEPRSGRIFATRAVNGASSDPAPVDERSNGSNGSKSLMGAARGSVSGLTAVRGADIFGSSNGSSGGDVSGGGRADGAADGPRYRFGSSSSENSCGGGSGTGAGDVSVLALDSGSFLDRGSFRNLNTTMEVPPTVFLEGVAGGGGKLQSHQNQQQEHRPLIPLPLQVYFLRSMAVLIQAGPGGGVDIPAVKAVLHAQGLERDKGLKDRSKPRRLASLPGHTDDLLRHTRGDESSGFPSGHLMPYRLIPGPLLRLTEGGTGGRSEEERRRFLVLYEIVASKGSDRPPPTSRDAALSEMSRTVCGLVTPAGYGEAHGRYENEAQLSHLFPATDGCFVSTSGQGEPSALLIEGGGYLAAVYSIPDMQLLGRKALSLPVTRVVATPDCLGSQRGKVLYVVRSPRSPSGFLETIVFSDRGGLQCPEPLLPVVMQGKGGGVAGGWAGGRPYANPHLVLEPSERVIDVKFQQLQTVAELSTWGYRRGGLDKSSPAVPMVAVLTTRRVLMLSATRLTPVAEAWGHPPNSRSALAASGGLSVSPVSMSWAGSSLVCALEDGRIVYLKPGSGVDDISQRLDEPDIPGGGSSVSSPWRPLCSVDRRLCAGGIGIAACLPDRLCLVARGRAGGGIAHLITRPFFPLEPLVAGLLAVSKSLPPASSLSSHSHNAGDTRLGLDGGTLDVLRRVVARYAPPRSRLPRGTNPGDGPGLGAGATCAVFRLLERYGLHVLAAEIAGVDTGDAGGGRAEGVGESRSADVFMRRRPWISPLERGLCAAKLHLPLRAMMEAIGDDPALVDTSDDPDAMTSAVLPAVGSRLSGVALALAKQSVMLGQHDDAARLLDLSGDDTLLEEYLSGRINSVSEGHPQDTLVDDTEREEETLGAAAAAERLRALRSAKETGGGVRGGAECTGMFRRSLLLAGVPPIAQKSVGGLKGAALEAAGGGAKWQAIREEVKPEGWLGVGAGGAGGGLDGVGRGPPASSLRPLALHCAEQWTGRVRPECLEQQQQQQQQSILRTSSFSRSTAAPATALVSKNTGGIGLDGRFATVARGSGVGTGVNLDIRGASSSSISVFASQSQPHLQPQQQQTVLLQAARMSSPDNTGTGPGMAVITGPAVNLETENALTVIPLASTTAAVAAAAVGASAERASGGDTGAEQQVAMVIAVEEQPWVSVGGSWKDEENVCGYWRFSEGAGGMGALGEDAQVEIQDLTKYQSVALARGPGLRFEDTSSPVDPGDKGKVAEAVDVCFPAEDAGDAVDAIGGYRRGVFVRAARGSSIDVGLFHDDQRRSVATVEAWFNPGEKPVSGEDKTTTAGSEGAEGVQGQKDDSADSSAGRSCRRFQQEFHVLACRVSASGEHVWSLVVENNGQVAFIPGPAGRRNLGPGFSRGGDEDADRGGSSNTKISALKEAVYTEPGTFSWDRWTHVAVTMDTSMDESSAEVKLFLDGQRLASGTCRFNKVRQHALAETWMILGPDLLGWKLTEARVWAMLRDEESLQDWKENSLSLAETKKARLIIRAVAKAKGSISGPDGNLGGITGRLAPPRGPGTGNAARRRSVGGVGVAPPPRDLKTSHGAVLLAPPEALSAGPTRDSRKMRLAHRSQAHDGRSRDPRKAALISSSDQSLPVRTMAQTGAPPPSNLPTQPAGLGGEAPMTFATFASFPSTAEDEPPASGTGNRVVGVIARTIVPTAKEEVVDVIDLTKASVAAASMMASEKDAGTESLPESTTGPSTAGASRQLDEATMAMPPPPSRGVEPAAAHPAVMAFANFAVFAEPDGAASGAAIAATQPATRTAAAAAALITAASTTETPVMATPTKAKSSPHFLAATLRTPSGGDQRAGVGRGFAGLPLAAELPTPTNSDISSIATPSSPWSAFGEDVSAATAAAAAALAAGAAVGEGHFDHPSRGQGGTKVGWSNYRSSSSVFSTGAAAPHSSNSASLPPVQSASERETTLMVVSSAAEDEGAVAPATDTGRSSNSGTEGTGTVAGVSTAEGKHSHEGDTSSGAAAVALENSAEAVHADPDCSSNAAVLLEGDTIKISQGVESIQGHKSEKSSTQVEPTLVDSAMATTTGEGCADDEPRESPNTHEEEEGGTHAQATSADVSANPVVDTAVSVLVTTSPTKNKEASQSGESIVPGDRSQFRDNEPGGGPVAVEETAAVTTGAIETSITPPSGAAKQSGGELGEARKLKSEEGSHSIDVGAVVPTSDADGASPAGDDDTPTPPSPASRPATPGDRNPSAGKSGTLPQRVTGPAEGVKANSFASGTENADADADALAPATLPQLTVAVEAAEALDNDVAKPPSAGGALGAIQRHDPENDTAMNTASAENVGKRCADAAGGGGDVSSNTSARPPSTSAPATAEIRGTFPQKEKEGAMAASPEAEHPGTAVRVMVEDHAITFAGRGSVVPVAEVASAHARSPLLASSPRRTSVSSMKGGVATVAVADLWNTGATTRYPIACLSAILSPRTNEQVIALLSEGGIQVFSVTKRIRRRHEVMKSSDVRLWMWVSDDIIAIVTKTAVLRWDVTGKSMPETLFTRRRPYDPSATAATRACNFVSTADGRWVMLAVADKEQICEGCSEDPTVEGGCACRTSLMLDLHNLGGSGETRCFRALGAALLDPETRDPADTKKSSRARVPSENALLAAIVPDADAAGSHVLRLSSLEGNAGEQNDDCLCSAVLQDDKKRAGHRQLRKYLRDSGLPAVPYHILGWRPATSVDLIAVVTLGGGLTVFQLDAEAVSLNMVFQDGAAFHGAVVGVKEDSAKGELVVLSAGVGSYRCWEFSRASAMVVDC